MGKMRKVVRPEYRRIQKALAQLANVELDVGFFATAKYPGKRDVSAAYVATIQENGVPSEGIPARPFMAPTAERETPNWAQRLDDLSRKVFDGKITARQALDQFGLSVGADISRSIDMVHEPPLAQATVERRAKKRKQPVTEVSRKPLIDTGYMQSSITHEVKE